MHITLDHFVFTSTTSALPKTTLFQYLAIIYIPNNFLVTHGHSFPSILDPFIPKCFPLPFHSKNPTISTATHDHFIPKPYHTRPTILLLPSTIALLSTTTHHDPARLPTTITALHFRLLAILNCRDNSLPF